MVFRIPIIEQLKTLNSGSELKNKFFAKSDIKLLIAFDLCYKQLFRSKFFQETRTNSGKNNEINPQTLNLKTQ